MSRRYLHVGSFNIEHFGRVDDNPDNAYAISEHVQMAGVDILALQEIYVTDSASFTNKHLDQALQLIEEQTGETWQYELLRNRTPGDTSQLCGVLWNSARVQHKKTLHLEVATEAPGPNGEKLRLWDRKPHALHFSAGEGKLDLTVVPLHMKSNVGDRETVMQTRAAEARTLMEQIPSVRKALGDEDIVLLGDTNCTGRQEPAIRTFVEGGFADLNEDDAPTYYRGNAPFDRIFVPRVPRRKPFRFSRQYVLRSASPLSHERFLSDHYIVKTTVKILQDDDHP